MVSEATHVGKDHAKTPLIAHENRQQGLFGAEEEDQ